MNKLESKADDSSLLAGCAKCLDHAPEHQSKLDKESNKRILLFQDEFLKRTDTSSTCGFNEEEADSGLDSEVSEKNETSQSRVPEFDREEVNYSDGDVLLNIFVCLQRDLEIKKNIVEELKSVKVSQLELAAYKKRVNKSNKMIGMLIFLNIVFAFMFTYYFFDAASLIYQLDIFNQLQMFFEVNFGGIF